ncbi:immunity 50 family protein [Variovorax sp. UC74_104]|uniref:immunity 50 family protein n=1 Tax=Variovorax sp. UC74_104 TaxID=3374555 RepID=UPI0037565301
MISPQKILNPQALISLYGEFPSLIGSEITEFALKRDEPNALIKIMTEGKPKYAPVRWPEDYDVVYLGLSFIGIKKMAASNWGRANVVDQFELEEVGGLMAVRVSCENGLSISFDCDWISIDSVVPGSIGSP